MRVSFRMSAIVAALAIVAAGTLAGCGQRGPLYMPTVPPLPPKPNFPAQPQPGNVKPTPETASEPVGSVPDTSGTPLSLSPDDELTTTPSSTAQPQPASGTKPTE
ncbi:LPS translocon maturation chaperone LptM [Paraburkholderia caballeronis]|uniref:Lipoprotein-attachment site-containing protein n=2 Tax=Paraburkholderia caballeronis TaxID=416943 RepID=A0A1H7UXG1_9BURK|nr:lipoprotein [Paraburkholderia caballeronis]PXW17408.1 putative lipoprotein [Paraburkholderia caballeronis]PXW94860.1 putative lipoprotein [Paraburkholderia caballeronis]RAJ90758.1 putative lipoprotein [Paraburkholderia caballeronis]TDV28558.1 putative lipoprotein [Paraburkholderia caballeronis]SEB56020.1 lipoprotein-attachment site-containing protein [Paraburkholderia caballeronis]